MSLTNYSTSAPIVRVAAAAEFLDAKQPDWLDIVKAAHLDLAGADECPLGQLGRHLDPDHSDPGMCYLVAVDAYGLDTKSMLALGFAGEADEIDSLNMAWIEVITARRRMANVVERAGVDDVEILPARTLAVA